MRNPGGYAARIDKETGKTLVEADTFSCRHCQRIVHVRPKERPEDIGGLCGMCHGLICPQCLGQGCDEIERKLERWEASYHARRSYGL
jgi:hypothetical protein